MRQKLIEAYIKAKKKPPGMFAADGGEVPDDSDDTPDDNKSDDSGPDESNASDDDEATDSKDNAPDDDSGDDEGDSDTGATPADVVGPPVSAKIPTDADKQAAMVSYLQEQLGKAGDSSDIKAAKADRSWRDMIAGIGQGAQQIAMAKGVAYGLAPPSGKEWDAIRSSADRGVQEAIQERQNKVNQFLQANQMQRQVAQDQMTKGTYDNQQIAAKYSQDRQDPTSQSSINAQNTLKGLFPEETKGMDLSNFSADDTEMAAKQIDVKGNQETRRLQMQEMADYKKSLLGVKQNAAATKVDTANDNKLDKDEKDMGTALDPNKARAGLVGDSQKRLNNAARASALIYETNPDGSVQKDNTGKPIVKDLNPTLMGEAAQSWASMISSGGSQADAAVERLLPHTASGQLANVKEWITSEPQGAGQQAFLKQMSDSIERERQVSEGLLKSAQVQAAGKFTNLKRNRSDAWDNQLVNAGIDPKDVDPNGRYNPNWQMKQKQSIGQTPSPQTTPITPITPEQATAELARRQAARAAATAGK